MKIANGFVFLDGKLRAGVELLLQNGVIAEAGPSLPPDETFDATGLIIAPGFVDIHIHGFAGRDMMEGADAVRTMSRELVRHGTTSFLPTTMTAPLDDTRRAVNGVSEAMLLPAEGAAPLGCHMEGPFFSPKRKGAQAEAHLALPSVEVFDGLSDECVRRVSLAPELDGAHELIRELVGRGVQASLAHTDATFDQVMEAVAVGASSVTHLFNAMTPLSHREPGTVGAALSCPQITTEFIADLVHLHPAALRIMFACKRPSRCVAVTDCMMAGGMPDGAYSLGGQDVRVAGGAVRLPDGTLAGSILTLRQSLKNMVTVVGVSLEDALPMYTSTPARLIGESGRGSLAAGSVADIVAFDAGFNIRAVWAGGRRFV